MKRKRDDLLQLQSKKQRLSIYEQAIEIYYQRDYDRSLKLFNRCLKDYSKKDKCY